jgi:hypothetical protein
VDPIRPDASRALIEALAALRSEGRGRRPAPGVAAQHGPASLRARLRELLANVSLADEPSLAAARLPVLHCILGDQYGGDLSTDPLYAEVLASLDRDIRERPELDAVFRQAIASLISGRSSPMRPESG